MEKKYPNILSKIEDKEFVEDIRDLVVVDRNYDDVDMEEVDIFDPNDYNFLVYVTERVQKILGKDGMEKLKNKIKNMDIVEEFIEGEEDLYGIYSPLDNEDEIGLKIVEMIEGELVC